jgi:phosphoribosylglycinamide formyltransferase-1
VTTRVAIFISGGGSNMEKLIESMTGDHPARPCLVLSNEPGAGGLAKAAAHDVPTAIVPHRDHGADRSAFEAALSQALAPHRPDIICLAGFMRKLTAGFVNPWQGAMLNIHPSLLPKYRGLHTHARALEAGDRQHGCTVHEVTPALDDGPILGQARLAIGAEDTPQSLAERVLVLEHRLYPAVLRRFITGEKEPLFLQD